jgi:hypothetical protein
MNHHGLLPHPSPNDHPSWLFPSPLLQPLWDETTQLPRLAEVAEIHPGVAFSWMSHCDAMAADPSVESVALGIVRGSSDLEPYIARPSRTLPVHPAKLAGQISQERSRLPKVITNAASLGMARWPIVGAIDEAGLVYGEDCYGVWPKGSVPIEVLAALINSPIVNAYLGTHGLFSEHNLSAVLEQAPIPHMSKADIDLITSLVRNYRGTRERWLSEQEGLTGRGILGRIESVVLGYYDLSLPVERALIAHFEGYQRPGPLELTQVEPSHQNGLWTTMLHVEDVYNEEDKRMVGVFVYNWEAGYADKIVHFPLSLVSRELREKIIPNTTLWAKVNVGAYREKDLVFENIEIVPEVSEEFRARFA